MRSATIAALVGGLVAGGASPGFAQVGYEPPKSPFRDLEYRQELSALGGYYAAAEDVAGVAPRGGPMSGLRYELRIGGPAQLFVRAARVESERRLLDTGRPAPERNLGVRAQPLYLADAGISLNLTGQKSFHNIVPVLATGLGIASDFKRAADQQADSARRGFKFGTPFALSFGGGVRWTPGGRFQLRVDATDYVYRIKYPSSFFAAPAGVPPVLPPTQEQSQWKNNLAITIGASYLFFR